MFEYILLLSLNLLYYRLTQKTLFYLCFLGQRRQWQKTQLRCRILLSCTLQAATFRSLLGHLRVLLRFVPSILRAAGGRRTSSEGLLMKSIGVKWWEELKEILLKWQEMKFWRAFNGHSKALRYFLKLIATICKCLPTPWDEMLGEPTFLRHTPRKNENNFRYFLVVFKLSIVLGVDIVLRLLNHLPLLKLFDNRQESFFRRSHHLQLKGTTSE